MNKESLVEKWKNFEKGEKFWDLIFRQRSHYHSSHLGKLWKNNKLRLEEKSCTIKHGLKRWRYVWEFVRKDLGDIDSFRESKEGAIEVSYSLGCSCCSLFLLFCILNFYCLTCIEKKGNEWNKENRKI